jgi:hypothetical protein
VIENMRVAAAAKIPAAAATVPTSAAAPPWQLPAIDWSRGMAFSLAAAGGNFSTRAFDVVRWPGDGLYYLYSDLIDAISDPACPSSYFSDVGAFSAPALLGPWTYRGLVVRRNVSAGSIDARSVATPTAIVRAADGAVLLFFTTESQSPGGGEGLRGIGGAVAAHPLGPFARLAAPVAAAPAGWEPPRGPGGILDDAEVLFFGGRFHIFHSRKHVTDFNCSTGPVPTVVEFCVEWRTSTDGEAWTRRGVLVPPAEGGPRFSTPMAARVYADTLVLVTYGDGAGWFAFTTPAAGLLGNDVAALQWTRGAGLNYSGFNESVVNVALRVLPGTGAPGSASPTHAALGWKGDLGSDVCEGGIEFAVFPLL